MGLQTVKFGRGVVPAAHKVRCFGWLAGTALTCRNRASSLQTSRKDVR